MSFTFQSIKKEPESDISCPIKTELTSAEHHFLDANNDPVNEGVNTDLYIHTEHKQFRNEGTCDINSTTTKTDLQEDVGSYSVKMEPLSPKPQELDGSDDTEYNTDVDWQFKVLKQESCYPLNTRDAVNEECNSASNSASLTKIEFVNCGPSGADKVETDYEVGERTLAQSQDLHIAVHSSTCVSKPHQSNISSDWCLIGHGPDRNTREKSFFCNTCNQSFAQNHDLLRHIRTHTREKPFSCAICNKSFTQKGHMKIHMHGHTGEKPLTCNVCNKSFNRKGYLITHMRTHIGEKPFSCSICKKSFIRKHDLMRHTHTHTGEKPFSCNNCKKSFTQKGHLLVHMRGHTGEKPFSCNVCKKSFTRRSSLLKHACTCTG